MKTILETLDGGTQWLEKKGIEDARRNMQLLICHQLDCSKIQLYTRFDETLDEEDLIPLREKLKLRGEGTPLQHLLGTVEFLRREFKTDGRALIPRPETEELVELSLELANEALSTREKLTSKENLPPENEESNNLTENTDIEYVEPEKENAPVYKILDMGCGSGVIGTSMAAELGMRAEVTCADISEEALSLAKENKDILGIKNVTFLGSNLFSNIEERYDLVIANLPYVPETDRSSLAPELAHDPDLALYSGEDGLDLIKLFVTELPNYLNDNAIVTMEIGIHQNEHVEKLLKHAGFTDISTKKDISGISRFPTARFQTKH